MVCSFLYPETIKPIKNFLHKNKDFRLLKYKTDDQDLNLFIDKEGWFITTPTFYKNNKIDGFFSVQLIKDA